MPIQLRLLLIMGCLLLMVGGLPAAAEETQPNLRTHQVMLPLVAALPPPVNPFGFDLQYWSSEEAVQYASDAIPKWTRAGDIRWADVEPVRGAGYQWESVSGVEANITRLQSSTYPIEPTLIIQNTPSWAQSVPGRLCSPPKPEYIADFARFVAAAVARYPQVRYWEIWNEPDVRPQDIPEDIGVGCWLDPSMQYNGGEYYGEVLKQIYPAIKAANPQAVVIAGALLYDWPDDSDSRTFLEGIMASDAGQSFDVLSFHAYGEWGAGDLLVNKTIRIRQVLSAYGLADKPLMATEVAAMCLSSDQASCPGGSYEAWLDLQANYAARIYAEAIALDLRGAFWYTLTSNNPGFRYSHLVDSQDGVLSPRPAYYAFLHSAQWLSGAHYIGPPVYEPAPDQMNQVQQLKFRKSDRTLYVLWVPSLDAPDVSHPVYVAPGATAICANNLQGTPDSPDFYTRYQIFYCSDTNNDGVIWMNVTSFPRYIEVLD